MTKFDIFFVGPPRTMTSKFMSLLSHHPGVGVDAVQKESKYFCCHYNDKKYMGDHFPHYSKSLAWVYCNPLYTNMEFIRDRIYKHNPDAKIVIGIRNPIDRAISHYGVMRHNNMPVGRVRGIWDEFDENHRTFNRRKIKSEGDFIPWVNKFDSCYLPQYFELGMYVHIIEMWQEKFEHNIVVYHFDWFKNNFSNAWSDLLARLDLPKLPEHLMFDEAPVHSLHQMGWNPDWSNLRREFRKRYPDIVYQYRLESDALSMIAHRTRQNTKIDYVNLWGL